MSSRLRRHYPRPQTLLHNRPDGEDGLVVSPSYPQILCRRKLDYSHSSNNNFNHKCSSINRSYSLTLQAKTGSNSRMVEVNSHDNQCLYFRRQDGTSHSSAYQIPPASVFIKLISEVPS